MIIYLVTNTYFNDRDKKRFGVDYFLYNGYKVIVLDVQDYLNPELNHLEKPIFKSHQNLEVIVSCNMKMVKSVIDKFGIGVSFLYIDNTYKSLKIKKYLQKNNIKIGILHGGMLPSFVEKKNKLYTVISKFQSLNIKNTVKIIFNKLYVKIFDIKYYDFLITANYDTSLLNYNFAKPIKIIETHCLDYDLVLENKNFKNTMKNKYVVFIDQYILNHSDFLRTNTKINIEADKYYKELNTLFHQIEKYKKYKVIIAAHPRAEIAEYKKLFNGRDIVYGNSIQLVKYCEFAMTHYSTAINFAIIYKKPILFLSNNEFNFANLNMYVKGFSNLLNQVYINLSCSYDIQNMLIKVDNHRYKEYEIKYIKKNNKEKNTYEIFENSFLQDEVI